MLPIHPFLPVPKIPLPSGPFRSVGIRDFQTKEKIPYRVFYPSSSAALSEMKFESWASHPRSFEGFAWFLGFPNFIFSHLKKWKIPAAHHLTLTRSRDPLPLYVFSHGLGGTPEAYSAHAIDMASYGFVVAMPHHQDQSAAWNLDENGLFQKYRRLTTAQLRDAQLEFEVRQKQLLRRVREVQCILDHVGNNKFLRQKTKLCAFSKSFVGGHSFGAATALEVARADTRIEALALADVWMLPLGKNVTALENVPMLDIQSQQWLDWEINFKTSSVLKPARTVKFPGSRHGNFSDFSLASNFINRALKIIGPADPATELISYSKHVREFFGEIAPVS